MWCSSPSQAARCQIDPPSQPCSPSLAYPCPAASANSPTLCTASIVKKVAAFAAAAELLRIAGEPAEKLMLFNGNTKDGLVAIGPLKDSASRARSSAAAPKGASVTSHPDFKRYVKTQYTIALEKNGGKCDKDARNAIGNALWTRLCVLAATKGASSAVKELHAKGKCVRPRSSRRLATRPARGGTRAGTRRPPR